MVKKGESSLPTVWILSIWPVLRSHDMKVSIHRWSLFLPGLWIRQKSIRKESQCGMSCFASTVYLKGSLASSRNTVTPEAEPSESHYFPNAPLNTVILVVRVQLLSPGEYKCNRVEDGFWGMWADLLLTRFRPSLPLKLLCEESSCNHSQPFIVKFLNWNVLTCTGPVILPKAAGTWPLFSRPRVFGESR